MGEVYVVTSGSYSDYTINGVYTDREAADARVAWSNSRIHMDMDEYRVEVYQLNEGRAPFAGPVWQSVWWATEASVNHSDSARAYETWYEGEDPGDAMAVEGEDYSYESAPHKTRYVIVRGHSKEHVEKSANDRRQRVRAEVLGIA